MELIPQLYCGITTFGSSGMTLPSGLTEFRGGKGRGVFGSGASNHPLYNVIQFITISTTGNSTDFGDDFKVREENYAIILFIYKRN